MTKMYKREKTVSYVSSLPWFPFMFFLLDSLFSKSYFNPENLGAHPAEVQWTRTLRSWHTYTLFFKYLHSNLQKSNSGYMIQAEDLNLCSCKKMLIKKGIDIHTELWDCHCCVILMWGFTVIYSSLVTILYSCIHILSYWNIHTGSLELGFAPLSKKFRHISLISWACSQACRNIGFPSVVQLLRSAP